MRTIQGSQWVGLLAVPMLLASAACTGAEQAGDAKVALKLAKFDELTKTLDGLKGKVVVVDFWADT